MMQEIDALRKKFQEANLALKSWNCKAGRNCVFKVEPYGYDKISIKDLIEFLKTVDIMNTEGVNGRLRFVWNHTNECEIKLGYYESLLECWFSNDFCVLEEGDDLIHALETVTRKPYVIHDFLGYSD